MLDLKEHWHSLPPDLQSAIAVFGSPKPRLIVDNGVTPAQVEAWIKTPETFFDLSADVPPRQLFTRLQELSSLDEDDGLAAIRRRIYLILFHDLRSAFNLLNTKLSFVAYLSSDGQYYDNTVKRSTEWARIGEKYKAIASQLGGNGTLLLIPPTIRRTT